MLLLTLFALTAFADPAAAYPWHAAKRIAHDGPTSTRVTMLVKGGRCNDYNIGGHINNSLWMSTNNSLDFSTWVEVGYTKGWLGDNILTWYWADKRPGSQEYDHRINIPISVGSTYAVRITELSSTSWGVYIDSTLRGTSTPNPDDNLIGAMQVGIETTDPTSALGTSDVPITNYALNYAQFGGPWEGRWGTSGQFTNVISGNGHATWRNVGIDLDCYYHE